MLQIIGWTIFAIIVLFISVYTFFVIFDGEI